METQLTLWGDVKQTALLQNYPNPFNPETWIPYQLASDSVVTLTVYNTKGERIRQIDLGEKPAGIYQTQADAIHWDGRTEKGEAAPSGIYFYTLDVAEYRHSGKMILLK
jgi:flagellar hook assembly protein FlgD